MKNKWIIIVFMLMSIIFSIGGHDNVIKASMNNVNNTTSSNTKTNRTIESSEHIREILLLTEIISDSDMNSVIITRAQFAKMLANASVYKEEGKVQVRNDLYKDVSSGNSYASYIKLAISQNWMSGYIDGTFRPNDGITLKDAAKGIVTLLGYGTTDDGKVKSTESLLEKFYELKLNKHIVKSREQSLTGEDCMNLFYNFLNTKTKTGQFYCETLDYKINEDKEIDFLSLLEDNLSKPFIANENWKTKIPFSTSYAIVYKNEDLSKLSDIESGNVIYYSKKGNLIWVYDERVTGVLDAISPNNRAPETITVDNETFRLGKDKVKKTFKKDGAFETGDTISFMLGLNNEVIATEIMKGPFVAKAKWSKQIPFSLKEATFYLNDSLTKQSNIKRGNILYYGKKTKTIWGYNNQITGAITAISPNDRDPENIVINNETFKLRTDKIKKVFSNSGQYEQGDTVTIMLGVNDEIVKTDTIVGPIIASGDWTKQIPFSTNNAIFYVNDALEKKPEVKTSNILYYGKKTKTVRIYNHQVVGKIEAIAPNNRDPKSITVEKETFTLGTDEIKKLFTDEGGFSEGDKVVLMLGPEDQVVETDTMLGPVITQTDWSSQIPISMTEATFYLNDLLCSSTDIKSDNALYYCKKANIVLAYNNKVSGRVEKIAPNLRSPETITIEEETFTLGNDIVKKVVSNQGSVSEDDYITVYLGKDDEVVVILTNETYGENVTGVIIEIGSKNSSNISNSPVVYNYMIVADAYGNTYTYDYKYGEKEYEEGDIVTVSLVNGRQEIGKITVDKNLLKDSQFNSDVTKLGEYTLAPNISIIDTYGAKSKKVPLNKLAGLKISSDNLKYYKLNAEGQIEALILYNVSGKDYSYGIITDIQETSASINAITYVVDGVEKTVSSANGKTFIGGLYKGAVCAIHEDDHNIYFDVLSSSNVIELTNQKITTNAWSKTITGDLQVYYKASDNTYHKTTIDKIKNLSAYSVIAYYDPDSTTISQARILVATDKE